MAPTRLLGTLARWNAERGFGFIAPDGGGADIFVHASDMSRIGGAPQVGWRLDFQVRPGKDGRPRAFDVQREGMPLGRTPVPAPSRAATPIRARRAPATRPRRSSAIAVLIVLVVGVGGYLARRTDPPQPPDAPQTLAAKPLAADAPSPFQCDGRTHCSEMRSCAEASYFLQHCPGVEMDGDGDGIACEQQWCH